jgi:hypothetical protein
MRLIESSIALLIICSAPAQACLNDQVTAEDEATFRSRYAESLGPVAPPAWWPGPGTGLAIVVIAGIAGFVLFERFEQRRARDANP